MNTLYVNNLNEKPSVNTLRRELERVFGSHKCTVHVRKTLALKGQAFVQFEDDVGDIISKYNNVEVLGRPMRLARAHEGSGKKRDVKIRIRHLKPTSVLLVQNIETAELAQLEDFFAPYHGLERVRLIAVRKLAFVEFESAGDAKKCMRSLKGLERFGNQIEVSYAKE